MPFYFLDEGSLDRKFIFKSVKKKQPDQIMEISEMGRERGGGVVFLILRDISWIYHKSYEQMSWKVFHLFLGHPIIDK